MKVLKILSDIWKSGANIYLDEKDNRIAIDKQNLIPVEVMQQAEENFQAIDDWFKSWKNETAVNKTMQKMVHQVCGWQHNEKLNEWLCSDVDSLKLFIEWQEELTRGGWLSIYDDFREFTKNESHDIAKRLYDVAVAYMKGGK